MQIEKEKKFPFLLPELFTSTMFEKTLMLKY